MNTILRSYFYREECSSMLTKILNRYMELNIKGFYQISRLYSVEELYNSIIDLLIEYGELSKELDNENNVLNNCYSKKSEGIESLRILDKIDSKSINDMISNKKNTYKYKYSVISDGKASNIKSLRIINDKIDELETSTNCITIRLNMIKSQLELLYKEMTELYDFDLLDKIFIGIRREDLPLLYAPINRNINDSDNSDYITNELYKTLLDEISYLLDVYNEASKLSFSDLNDEKLEELKQSKKTMNEQHEMISLKRDVLEYLFSLCYSQSNKSEMLRNKNKLKPAKAIIKHTNEYLNASRYGKVNKLDKMYTYKVLSSIEATNPNYVDLFYASRLYKYHKQLLNK